MRVCTMWPVNIDGHGEDGAPSSCTAESCLAAVERDDRWIGANLSIEHGGRAHFHHVSELRAEVRGAHAARFMELAMAYEGADDDFVAAWAYLAAHPIFHRPVLPTAHDRLALDLTEQELHEVPEFVDDCDGLRDMWMHVSRAADGSATVSLEHGPHLWAKDIAEHDRPFAKANGRSSHDHRLDVSAPCYETAIIALARAVRRHYGHDRSRV